MDVPASAFLALPTQGSLPTDSERVNVDTLTPSQRSERMSRVRGKDTKPELLVRRLAHGLGFRYRLHSRVLPGKPDLVFALRRKVIFVHGCMWHQHPGCGRMPKSRLAFWRPKLEGNRERDLRNQRELRGLGWRYLIVWECEVRRREALTRRLSRFLKEDTA
jgi:DNA mismatch endonuclease (patch repair protein)